MTVLGSASVPGRPDEAVLRLELESVKPSAEAAYEDVAARHGVLESLLGELGIPDERRVTTSVSVHENREYDGGRYLHRGFAASSRVTVRTRDTVVAARLLQEAVSRARASVEGPWWSLDADNPAHVAACSEAAVEARRKADAYAGALGLRVASVLEVREPGTGPTRPQVEADGAVYGIPARGGAIPVSAGELAVRAAVEVTFALEPA